MAVTTALVISPNFPPTNKVSSLRAYYLAAELVRRRWRVDVLASDDQDLSLPRSETGMQVTRVRGGRLARVLRAAASILVRRLRGRQYGVIVSSYGPSESHMIGRLAKACWPEAAWVADYRDVWTTDDYYRDRNRGGLTARAKTTMETATVRAADLLMTVSPTLCDHLRAVHGKDVVLMYNGYEDDASGAISSMDQEARQDIVFCYTGTIYSQRSPIRFLEVLRGACGVVGGSVRARLVIAGHIDPASREALAPYISEGLAEHVGLVDRATAYRMQAAADYCLLIEDVMATRKGVLTGKVFEYIGMQRPVVALGVACESDMAYVLRTTGIGAFVGQPDGELAVFLQRVLAGEVPALEVAHDQIRFFRRSVQSERGVTAILDKATHA